MRYTKLPGFSLSKCPSLETCSLHPHHRSQLLCLQAYGLFLILLLGLSWSSIDPVWISDLCNRFLVCSVLLCIATSNHSGTQVSTETASRSLIKVTTALNCMAGQLMHSVGPYLGIKYISASSYPNLLHSVIVPFDYSVLLFLAGCADITRSFALRSLLESVGTVYRPHLLGLNESLGWIALDLTVSCVDLRSSIRHSRRILRAKSNAAQSSTAHTLRIICNHSEVAWMAFLLRILSLELTEISIPYWVRWLLSIYRRFYVSTLSYSCDKYLTIFSTLLCILPIDWPICCFSLALYNPFLSLSFVYCKRFKNWDRF